ncbi:particle associated protein [Yersinia phage fHe-Yen8-01]|nr:particle associated protein [Yersinia phage fHe-Yen8-01]
MSLFQCNNCGCVENTACSNNGFRLMTEVFDWSYAPDRRWLALCSACGPVKYATGKPTDYAGQWHGRFPRVFLTPNRFRTASNGNLEHIVTGEQDYTPYIVEPPNEQD